MSRAGLPLEVRVAVEEILQELGQAQRVSLTGLQRWVRRRALKALGNLYRSGETSGHDSALSLTGLDR
jgi:hypothetical protein